MSVYKIKYMVLFETDPDFCPQCGSIVIIPKKNDSTKCDICNYLIIYSKFENIYSKSKIFFNEDLKTKKYDKKRINVDNKLNLGPLVDRVCIKCGCEQMSYTTLQTRSADEGQTVFYTCVQCNNKEIEYA